MEIPQRAVMFCQLGFQSGPSAAGNLSVPCMGNINRENGLYSASL